MKVLIEINLGKPKELDSITLPERYGITIQYDIPVRKLSEPEIREYKDAIRDQLEKMICLKIDEIANKYICEIKKEREQ